MKFMSVRQIFSTFLGLLLLGVVAPNLLKAQSSSSQTPSSAQTPSSSQSQNSSTTKKKPKKSSSSTAASASSASPASPAPPTITQQSGVASADSRASTATRTSASSRSGNATTPTVWVNTDTKTYHTEGSKYYGKTKHGRFMSEEDAKKQGFKRASN